MAPIKEEEVSNLEDQQLSDMLKEYGVDVGPINVATRRTYERKLVKLSTGQIASPRYPPVQDEEEEEDNEVILKPQTINYQTPPPSGPRHRPVAEHKPTPRGDAMSRPSLPSVRKTTTNYASPRAAQSSSQQQRAEAPQSSGGIPKLVIVAALAVFVILGYLIFTNMESNAASQIPHIPSKVEV